jgi:hypothetical protein
MTLQQIEKYSLHGKWFFIGVFATVLLIGGCAEDGGLLTTDYAIPSDDIKDALPDRAENIQDVGNGWFTFDIMSGPAAGCYLVKQSFAGYSGYGYITQRPCG